MYDPNVMYKYVCKHCDEVEGEQWKISNESISWKDSTNNVEKQWLKDVLYHVEMKYLQDLVNMGLTLDAEEILDLLQIQLQKVASLRQCGFKEQGQQK